MDTWISELQNLARDPLKVTSILLFDLLTRLVVCLKSLLQLMQDHLPPVFQVGFVPVSWWVDNTQPELRMTVLVLLLWADGPLVKVWRRIPDHIPLIALNLVSIWIKLHRFILAQCLLSIVLISFSDDLGCLLEIELLHEEVDEGRFANTGGSAHHDIEISPLASLCDQIDLIEFAELILGHRFQDLHPLGLLELLRDLLLFLLSQIFHRSLRISIFLWMLQMCSKQISIFLILILNFLIILCNSLWFFCWLLCLLQNFNMFDLAWPLVLFIRLMWMWMPRDATAVGKVPAAGLVTPIPIALIVLYLIIVNLRLGSHT